MNLPNPAAELRKLMDGSFSLDEIKVLCFDLSVDFDALSGDDKGSKIIGLIQHSARNNRVVDLVDACRKTRPSAKWDAVGAAAATTPAAFSFVPTNDATTKPVLNISPDRAVKLGFAAGVLSLLLVFCGFSGGLLANNLIDVTISPVQPNKAQLDATPVDINSAPVVADGRLTHMRILQTTAVGALASGTPVKLAYNNVTATTLVDELLKTYPGGQISDPHLRFNRDGEGTFNFVSGGRRYVVGFTAKAQADRLVITPTRAVAQFLPTNNRFGWIYVPVSFAQPATDWAQKQLDAFTANLRFTDVKIGEDSLMINYSIR